MWNLNLSNLAAKAQEAAARLERQLDDSVGLNSGDDATTEIAAADDNINDDDDDFFSDDNHANTSSTTRPQEQSIQANSRIEVLQPLSASNTPVSTKSNITDHDNDDDNDEQVVNFGADTLTAVDGNGWDDADEIYDDDDDDDDEEFQENDKKGEQEELNNDKQGSIVSLETTIENSESLITTQTSPSIDETALNQMMEMGCSINGSKRALLAVGGSDVEAAMNWVFEHSDDPDFNDPLPEEDVTESEQIQTTMQYNSEEKLQEAEQEKTFQEDTAPIQVNDTAVLQPPPPQDDYNDSIPSSRPSPQMDEADIQRYLRSISDLELRLQQREEQLASKSDMIASLSEQHESELLKLREVVSETKEEAKKRIIKAKERVEEMQTKLNEAARRADAAAGSGHGQSEVINELRAEGEKLAKKQGEMEQMVRKARGEARDLEERLDIEKAAHEKEVTRAEGLEKEVKSLKEGLSSARKGESQSKKLEGELMTAKEETEKQRASNMVLDQQLKELKVENKSLKKDVEEARAGSAIELQVESNKLRRERDDMLSDLEGKLRTSEREANVREDALRHEVSELRKRWQDAVRRAEDLSMDVQQSTAPLMRQLESTERQNRHRAAAWAEIETKLRSDLEDHIIKLEKLTKERNELASSDKRSQRFLKEKEEEIASSLTTIDALTATIGTLEKRLEGSEEEIKRIKQELIVAERKASEGASKVRNEMMQTVVDSEERYRSQIDSLEEALEEESQRRALLETQMNDLVQSVSSLDFSHNSHTGNGGQHSPEKERKLISASNQASILQSTLAGFDSDIDDDDDDEQSPGERQAGGSFAAMEQLSLGLKGAKTELEALRKQLVTSEEIRASLLDELGAARQAVEKLPLFEQKISELTMEVKLKEMEIQGLKDDIADVKFLYRSQLDDLLEAKAISPLVQQDDYSFENALVVDE